MPCIPYSAGNSSSFLQDNQRKTKKLNHKEESELKNKRIVRILSLVLVLIMTLSLAPVSVSAETTGDSESAGWSEWWNRGIGGNFKQLPLDPIPVDEGEREDIIAIECPAVDFSEVIDDLFIFVDAPVGALPDGTEMTVAPVSLDAVQTAVDNTDGVAGTVLAAADISFFCNGEEIQPNRRVSVTMTSAALADVENASVIHLDASAAELESEEENAPVEAEPVDGVTAEAESVSFEAKQFSVYAVIGEAVIDNDEGTLTFNADNYDVTVTYTKDAQIPAGTKLTVSEIPYGSDEYNAYLAAAQEKLNENAVFGSELGINKPRGIADAIFVDVSLEYDGKPFEPAVPLDVKITLNEGALYCPAGEEALVVHFGDKGTELIEDVAVGLSAYEVPDGMPEGQLLNSFDYEQNGFSVVGLFTTDVYINFEAAQPGNPDLLNAAGLFPGALRADGDPTINAGKTVTDNDGDGIYELALSVNATSTSSSSASVTKSNVVMVIDVSGSMGNDDSWVYYSTYTYDAATYDQFRYYSSSSSTSTRLYYGQFRTGGYGSQVRTGWYSGGNTYNGNVYYATAYSGTVYAYETRLHATQRAACAVVDALLAYNTNSDNITDVFEITVVKFAERTASGNYNGTETIIKDSTNATAIKTAINGLTAGGGTHWRAALEQALEEANYFKNTDPSRSTDPDNPENTSVIFLTDGFPTERGEGNEGGSESNDNVSRAYRDARTPARNIVSGGFTLYNIFAFGSDTITHGNTSGNYNTGSHTGFQFLCGLANYAYGSGTTDNFSTTTNEARQYCFNAKSTDALVQAFNTIISHITNSVGFAGVNISDGVSLGATSTSVAVNGEAKADSMRYTVTDSSGNLSYAVRFSNGKATFTIYNEDGTTTTLEDSTPETVTTTIGSDTINSQVYSVTVGTGDAAETYEMSPATIDADTGMVKWDLAGLGILKSGYTYAVAFDVWPQQLTYDIAADLNNGIYEDVDEALEAYNVPEADRQRVKDAIVKQADGSYAIYTNYEQSVEYYPATETTDDQGNTTWEYGTKQSNDLPQPDPVPLQGSSLPLAKVWESSLAISELNELLWENGEVGGTSKEYQITLHVWKADTEDELMTKVNTGITATNQPYITQTLGWDETAGEYIFEKDVAVAPGMMLNVAAAAELGYDVTDQSKLREFTNDQGVTLTYYVIESGHYYYVTEEGSDLHFELDVPLYHPMIVDGTLYNVFFGSGNTVEKMDPMYAVVATNYLKGGLNISKVVLDFEDKEVADVEDEFAFKITLWREDEDGIVSPVYTYDDQFDADNKAISGSIGYREFGKITDEETGDRELLGRNVIIFENSTNAEAKIEINKRGSHDPVYATQEGDKTVIILRMPACGEIRIVNLPSGTKYTVEEIEDTSDDPVYAYNKNRSGIKYSQEQPVEGGEEGDVEVVETVDWGDFVTTNTANGSIVGNKANVEEFYNKTDAYFYIYHSSDNSVERVSFTDSRVTGTFDTATSAYTYTFSMADAAVAGTLYGGYYSDYSGKSAGFEGKNVTEWAEDNTYVDNGESVFAYDGTGSKVWDLDKAYTVNGFLAPVEKEETYYIKEVPADKYLQPYLHYTYYKTDNHISSAWLISDVDDLNYQETGFVISTADETALVASSLTVQTTHGGSRIKLTPKRVFTVTGADNRLSYLEVMKNASGTKGFGENVKILQYWVTPDGLIVTGNTMRTYTGIANKTTIDKTQEAVAITVDVFQAPAAEPDQP